MLTSGYNENHIDFECVDGLIIAFEFVTYNFSFARFGFGSNSNNLLYVVQQSTYLPYE